MKKHFILLPLLALAVPAAAQHVEVIGRAGLGLFKFGGKSAQSTSFVNYYNGAESGYTNSPYGSRWGTGLVLGGRMQRVGSQKGLLALGLGYEWLRSRTNITSLYYASSPGIFVGAFNAEGSTALQTQNLTAFLGLGHRFQRGVLEVDGLIGPELAYIFGFREKGSGTYNGGTAWTTDQRQRAFNRFDARLRADVTAWYRRVGANVSYSYGVLNYQSGLVGASPEVYSRTLRLGLAYRLR